MLFVPCVTHLFESAGMIVDRANLPGILYRYHVGSNAYKLAILFVYIHMNFMSSITLHPSHARNVRPSSEKRTRNMAQLQVAPHTP
jgi:hypothetical protein